MDPEIIRAIVLGIVQGLTEFLPVSSSGHLELSKAILGDNTLAEESLLMTVTLHFGTALATVVAFRKEILQICTGLFKFQYNAETNFSAKIILSMVPATIVGLLFEEEIEQLFSRQILLVGICLALTGLLLFWANNAKKSGRGLSFADAFLIGIAQAIAILPGISRSGATISSSVLLGIDREQATRFSFLMVVPLIFGKMAKDLLDGEIGAASVNMAALGVGFVFAFVTGYFACLWMIRIVKQSQLNYFAVYCLIIGLAASGWALFANS
jgi:undecaprenyl-diphosphatase